MAIIKNVICHNEKDLKMIDKGINYNVWLLCGNDLRKQKNLQEYFVKKIKHVAIWPKGTKHSILNNGILGYCSADEGQNITIEMLGYDYLAASTYKLSTHEAVHEFKHALSHVASTIFRNRNLEYEYDNCKYSVHGGNILKFDKKTKKYSMHGRLFDETLTDILTSIALVYLDDSYRLYGIKADDILTKGYNTISKNGYTKTGYTVYTAITRLAIAAFNNNPNINYDDLIQSGGSIILAETRDRKENKYKLNDFIYGITCDPLYLEKEYDKYMGYRAYSNLIAKLDKMFKDNKLSTVIIKETMKDLAIYLNRKLDDLYSKGCISLLDRNKLISNFNTIFNDLQQLYSSYFYHHDIEEIKELKKISL